jgi:hypothetical protein
MIGAALDRPDRDQLLGWLTSPSVLLPTGEVLDGASPKSAGKADPESAGVLLACLARAAPPAHAARARIARRLEAQRGACGGYGGIGSAGRETMRATAAVLGGLVAHAAARGRRIDGRLAGALQSLLGSAIRRRSAEIAPATEPEPGTPPPPPTWTAAELQCTQALLAYAEHGGGRESLALCEDLADPLLALQELEGRFRNSDSDSRTDLAAHVGALEGLAALAARGWDEFEGAIRAGASWLERVQGRCGGLQRSWSPRGASGPVDASITARAARLWFVVDPKAYEQAIVRALERLAGMQVKGGGLRPSDDSVRVDTRASAYAVQAVDFAERGGDARCMY